MLHYDIFKVNVIDYSRCFHVTLYSSPLPVMYFSPTCLLLFIGAWHLASDDTTGENVSFCPSTRSLEVLREQMGFVNSSPFQDESLLAPDLYWSCAGNNCFCEFNSTMSMLCTGDSYRRLYPLFWFLTSSTLF